MLRAFALVSALVSCGCTPLDEIRTEHKAALLEPAAAPTQLSDCHSGNDGDAKVPGALNSIENYGKYQIGYVEFDDQGWYAGPGDKSSQMQVLTKALDADANHDLLILVFVHGWHHNAHTNDCNVRQFRAMVQLVNEAMQRRNPNAKVFGVYAAWRGESVDFPVANHSTIYTRKITAEHVAKGSVRELFARLKLFETNQRMTKPGSLTRTVVIGHSFGGLIAFHSLSQSMLEEIVFGNIKCEERKAEGGPSFVPTRGESAAGVVRPPFPDLTILINPAFESSRYEALFQATILPDANCTWAPRKRPLMLTLASDNDWATGKAFPVARWFATIFEGYNRLHRDDERNANLNVIGYVDRYRTHRLERCRVNGQPAVVLSDKNLGPTRDVNSPLMVARATPDVLYGHDGFLYSPQTQELNTALLQFLTTFYVEGRAKVMEAKCDN